jgi:type II secretion system protein N
MKFVRYTLSVVIAIPVLIILVWYFAIPDDYLQSSLENAVAAHSISDIDIDISGFRKGLFFTTHADSLDISMDKKHLVSVTDLKSSIHLLDSIMRKQVFSLHGKIGSGDVNGFFNLPDSGSLTVDKADLQAISYLKNFGIEAEGFLSANLVARGDTVDILFQIPNAEIKESPLGELLTMKSFQKIQGALTVRGNTVKIKSISLEADKGYARLKGDIKNRFMSMTLEIMPEPGKLESFESMLLANYLVTPGYYVIPIEGPIL